MHITGINATINSRYVGEAEIRPNGELVLKLHEDVLLEITTAFMECLADGLEVKVNWVAAVPRT